MSGEQVRGLTADVADSERENQPPKRPPAACVDRGDEVIGARSPIRSSDRSCSLLRE